jgi:hypothetical protein
LLGHHGGQLRFNQSEASVQRLTINGCETQSLGKKMNPKKEITILKYQQS